MQQTSTVSVPDWQELRRVREEIMAFSRAQSTVKSYDHGWKKFTTWCSAVGRQPLPATPATVLDYVTCRLDEGRYRLSTIVLDTFSIQFHHLKNALETPVDPEVRKLLKIAARKLRQHPRRKRALTPRHLRQMGDRLLTECSGAARRDHAMILLGFAAGWRSSEVVSLFSSDVWFEDGRMFVQLGASKTDQDARLGRQVVIPPGQHPATCPVQAMRNWLAVRGSWQGPLFCRFTPRGGEIVRKGIGRYAFSLRFKALLKKIGENPAPFGTHSIRSGMITSSAENGADVVLIMQRTGQRSVQNLMRYIRPIAPFRADPLAGVL
jgi:integrase